MDFRFEFSEIKLEETNEKTRLCRRNADWPTHWLTYAAGYWRQLWRWNSRRTFALIIHLLSIIEWLLIAQLMFICLASGSVTIALFSTLLKFAPQILNDIVFSLQLIAFWRLQFINVVSQSVAFFTQICTFVGNCSKLKQSNEFYKLLKYYCLAWIIWIGVLKEWHNSTELINFTLSILKLCLQTNFLASYIWM
jgi:hypothetical protein